MMDQRDKKTKNPGWSATPGTFFMYPPIITSFYTSVVVNYDEASTLSGMLSEERQK